jgi:N utilization substance protein A
MATGVAANRLELLQIADAVARDKSIEKSVVIHAMEEAMQRAAKARYGSENEIRVDIDQKTGETHVSRYLHVVELVDNDKIEISLEDARARNPAAQVGDIIAETLPPVDFSRIAAQAANTRNTRTASARSCTASSSGWNSAQWWSISARPKAWCAATR